MGHPAVGMTLFSQSSPSEKELGPSWDFGALEDWRAGGMSLCGGLEGGGGRSPAGGGGRGGGGGVPRGGGGGGGGVDWDPRTTRAGWESRRRGLWLSREASRAGA